MTPNYRLRSALVIRGARTRPTVGSLRPSLVLPMHPSPSGNRISIRVAAGLWCAVSSRMARNFLVFGHGGVVALAVAHRPQLPSEAPVGFQHSIKAKPST